MPFNSGKMAPPVNSDVSQGYADSQKGVKTRVVSNNPFVSPVPLEALKNFQVAYSSPASLSANTNGLAGGQGLPVRAVTALRMPQSCLTPS